MTFCTGHYMYGTCNDPGGLTKISVTPEAVRLFTISTDAPCSADALVLRPSAPHS